MSVDWPPEEDEGAGAEYEGYADVYDALFGSARQDTEFYLKTASAVLDPGASLLELGVGTGAVAAHFLESGYRVVGVDASGQMLERARIKLGGFGPRFRVVHADFRRLHLDERFRLIIAPFGTLAHVLADQDRKAVFAAVHAHLEPGGVFVFDDRPAWLSGPADGSRLELLHTGHDPVTGQQVRLLSSAFDAAGGSVTVSHDLVDWLHDGHVVRRKVLRLVFRNATLAEDTALLRLTGFADLDVLGAFDGRRFDAEDVSRNERVIVQCRRP